MVSLCYMVIHDLVSSPFFCSLSFFTFIQLTLCTAITLNPNSQPLCPCLSFPILLCFSIDSETKLKGETALLNTEVL